MTLQAARPERDQPAAVPDVGEAAERDAEDGVEDGEGGAVEEADLRVGDAEVGLDALGEDREDLAVEEVEDVDEDQDAEDVARRSGRPARRMGHGGSSHRCARPAELSSVTSSAQRHKD